MGPASAKGEARCQGSSAVTPSPTDQRHRTPERDGSATITPRMTRWKDSSLEPIPVRDGANPSLCAMSVGTPPPWWWLASDGRWYPPELRRRDHVALRQSSVGAARQPRLRLVSSALVVGILAAATGLGVTAASSARYSDPGARSAAVIAPVAPSTSAIWFQPQPPGVFGPFGQVPSAHYLALFRPGAPWSV